MTLRLRLLLSFAYLVVLVLATAVTASLNFLHLASGIDRVLTENFASVAATFQMRTALDGLDRTALEARSPLGLPATIDAQRRSEFLDALAEAEANVTESEEPEVLGALRDTFEAYLTSRERLLASAPDNASASYDRVLAPRRAAVESAIDELRKINEQAMFRAEATAKRSAVRSATVLGALVALSLLSFVFMSRALHRSVLDRLDELRDGVSQLGSGDRVRRVRERGADELSVIAREINRLVDRLLEAEASGRGRLARERRLTLGLLARTGDGGALFSRDGSLLAGSLGDPELHREIGHRLRELDEDAVLEPRPGSRFQAAALAARPAAVDGWLVTPDPPAS